MSDTWAAWVLVYSLEDGGLLYWSGDHWTVDNAEALRLSRKVDAERLLTWLRKEKIGTSAHVEEHLWSEETT